MIEEKIKIELDTKKLYLLNQPFRGLKKSEDFARGRVSSYHDELENEPNWFRYWNLNGPLEVVVGESEEQLLQEEMLIFIAENNGFALSRDNLFALYSVFGKKLNDYVQKNRKDVSIVAAAHEKFLPEHKNELKICPMIEIEYKGFNNNSINYDWSWINDKRMPIKNFAFFRHVIDRSPLIY